MKTLQTLLALDGNTISQELLREQLKQWQTQYHKEKENALSDGITSAAFDTIFVEETKQSMELLLTLIKKQHPELFQKEKPKATMPDPCAEMPKETPKKTSAKKTRTKPKSAKKKKKKTTKTPEQTQKIDKVIEDCRLRIRAYQQAKREAQEKAGTLPKKPTRYDKIRSHLIALGNLIPDPLKKDLETQMQVKRLLLRTQNKLIDLYQMSPRRAEKQVQHIKDKYEAIAEKLNPKTN